jgi:thiosulfate/3-mercaptopyruvate sulfurtransferase
MTEAESLSATMPTPLVETGWLAAHLDDPDLRVLDCSVAMQFHDDGSYSFTSGRPAWEQGHIPGSQFVDVLSELSDPDAADSLMMPPPEIFARTMAARGVGDGTRVVLYDNSNHAWAARVWWMLRVCGFDDAAVLNGGWKKWIAENRPQSTAEPQPPHAAFTVRARPQLMATKDDVLAALGRAGVAIINALSPESFRGEVQLFPRPGRIPGSRNVYCQNLVNPATHAYADVSRLRELFAGSGALEADRVITYCGGGIAASSDALALTLLGVGNVAVYDGSLAEWTADPQLPLETG